ncbi:hypothetical protein C8R46DRAFT_23927 [Mycena filopes]|nr:hypothetical protein C8R46DRAFT_23927 [Mycena filopes]
MRAPRRPITQIRICPREGTRRPRRPYWRRNMRFITSYIRGRPVARGVPRLGGFPSSTMRYRSTWLGQVAILAHQEGLPPFNSANNETGEIRFKMVKRWLRRIQEFLNEGDGESTLFWDELMKIRLQAWQLEYDTDGGADDQDGLLGFFP